MTTHLPIEVGVFSRYIKSKRENLPDLELVDHDERKGPAGRVVHERERKRENPAQS